MVAFLFTLSGLASALATSPAYYIAEFQATDHEAIKPYSAQVESTFRPFGGHFIVRGGDPDVKEGVGAQSRLVVIKFGCLKNARDWYNSAAYQKIIPVRHHAGNLRTCIVRRITGAGSCYTIALYSLFQIKEVYDVVT
ncbi:TPA: DUF1330 domain-containing protein [Escherichia coli]|uniref:DUF1330 domain-containing protein n=1 Tax=Escherichia coli TaxID=562 RepID=UPI002026D992|nr:DUF1330 domain-containing protein [Escherichia coli]MDW4685076.1 DUF1330 domain-containing protein [Escherichia coli]MDZ7157572.1 DUF1330 domain-containing protein [Escherichia coli]MDZ7255210.1 DUF1330 domain-containing protein [Escherichia coli]